MNKALPAPTPAELAAHLAAPPGSKERFGKSSAEVLDTAALIAAAAGAWDKATIRAIQDAEDLHPKVWEKMVSIHRDQRLESLKKDLPASYTALYALVVMKDEELEAAVQEGLVTPKSSSRSILDWTKAYRLRGTGIDQEVPLTLVLKEELSDQRQQDLLAALKKVAEEYGAEVREGKVGLRQSEVKAEARKSKAQEIESELLEVLGPVVQSAPEELKARFQVHSALDLIEGRRDAFTGFLQVLEGKVKEVFWRKYGRAYCLKIARDFNLTDSRAERYQFKDRLKKAVEKWGTEIPGFDEVVEEVLTTYMGG